MGVEIEAKMRVDDLGAIEAKVRDLGGTRIGDLTETDTFFDTDDRQFTNSDQALRLRVETDNDSGETTAILTYKSKQAGGQLKKRIEIETPVANANACRKLFEAIGYHQAFTYQKRRRRWRYTAGGKSCHVELDTIPYLGNHVEIEGPDDETVMHVREQLGLADAPLIATSYASMLMDHLIAAGDDSTKVMLPRRE